MTRIDFIWIYYESKSSDIFGSTVYRTCFFSPSAAEKPKQAEKGAAQAGNTQLDCARFTENFGGGSQYETQLSSEIQSEHVFYSKTEEFRSLFSKNKCSRKNGKMTKTLIFLFLCGLVLIEGKRDKRFFMLFNKREILDSTSAEHLLKFRF